MSRSSLGSRCRHRSASSRQERQKRVMDGGALEKTTSFRCFQSIQQIRMVKHESCWSIVLFGPFLMLARAYAMVKRCMRKESVYDKIVEGLYLGGWPFLLKHMPPGSPSVIDCTCELPRSSFVPADEYLCLATWDTRAPTPYQTEHAARWACQKRSEGKPVYVHCAFGHGRSACVVCAILIALGVAETSKDAENIIRERRKIKMNALELFTAKRWKSDPNIEFLRKKEISCT